VNNASFEVRPLGAEFENGAEFELNLQRPSTPDEDFESFRGRTSLPGDTIGRA
jgi:hypothetical protein